MKRCSSLVGVLFFAALSIATPPPAQAQQPTAASTAAQDAEVDAIFRQGNDLYKNGQFAEAEAAYERAFALKQTHDIASQLAYAEMKLNRNAEAALHLAFALEHFPPAGNEEKEKKKIALGRMASLRKSVVTLKLKETTTEGAEIFVDGQPVGRFPELHDVFVEPGERTVEAKLAGHTGVRQVVQGAAGEEKEIALVLPASPPAQATPSEATQPEVPPLMNRHEPPAPRPAKQPHPPPQELQPQSSNAPVRMIVIGAGATTSALLVGAGATFTIWSNQTALEANALRESLQSDAGPNGCATPDQFATACHKLRTLGEDQSRNADVALWTFVAGGAAAVGTLVYALVTRNKPDQAAVQIFPSVHTGSTTLIVRGQW